jgi:hypothetical protein
MSAQIRKVSVWPRKCWLPPSLTDLAYALQRAAERHPTRDTFTASELFRDFAGPSPAVASRIAKGRSVQMQHCLRSLGLELVAHELGAFTIRRRPERACLSASERNAA